MSDPRFVICAKCRRRLKRSKVKIGADPYELRTVVHMEPGSVTGHRLEICPGSWETAEPSS